VLTVRRGPACCVLAYLKRRLLAIEGVAGPSGGAEALCVEGHFRGSSSSVGAQTWRLRLGGPSARGRESGRPRHFP